MKSIAISSPPEQKEQRVFSLPDLPQRTYDVFQFTFHFDIWEEKGIPMAQLRLTFNESKLIESPPNYKLFPFERDKCTITWETSGYRLEGDITISKISDTNGQFLDDQYNFNFDIQCGKVGSPFYAVNGLFQLETPDA